MWYVIQSLNGDELNVCEKCRQAVPKDAYRDFFVPMYVCMRRYQGVWSKEHKVLFPGYFFIDTEQPEIVEKALSVVARIAKPVCVGKQFVPILEEEQDFLEDMMDASHIIQMSTGNIINGEFDIYEGPLQEKAAYLKRIDRHKRIAEMEVRLLGKPRRVRVGLEIVKKIAV